MPRLEMEERVSGFKIRGDWGDVVEHGERLTRALRDVGAHDATVTQSYPDAFAEWDEWRPKVHERLDDDISEKTAQQASIDEGDGEKADAAPSEDLEIAGEKLIESYDQLEDDEVERAVETAEESVEHAARAADTAGRDALRTVEETVYERVMTQLAPYYFDNGLISANIQRGAWDDEQEFIFEINVNDDLKAAVSDRLAAYEETVDRWHVTTDRETEIAEAAEGVDAPDIETEPDDGSRPTTN